MKSLLQAKDVIETSVVQSECREIQLQDLSAAHTTSQKFTQFKHLFTMVKPNQ
jgi:hypothetical protein